MHRDQHEGWHLNSTQGKQPLSESSGPLGCPRVPHSPPFTPTHGAEHGGAAAETQAWLEYLLRGLLFLLSFLL